MAPRGARDVVRLLAALQASDPGRPRLTWYGPDGERVELSARVLATWVAKTANLLVEELDAEPGTTVLLDLPPHWRTAVWALATWAVGGQVSWPTEPTEPTDTADVVVTTRPADVAAGGQVVAVALPALARSFGHDAAGALDYAAVVAGFGDVFVPPSPQDPAELVNLTAPHDAWPDEVRLLCVGGDLDLRRDLLGALQADGSLVLCHAEPTAEVVGAERVTDRSPGRGGVGG